MNYEEVAKNYNEYQVTMRRYFHENPEISTKEYNTSKVVKDELTKMGVEWVPCGLETGVLATIKGAKPGKTILLRGDMDALSVTEGDILKRNRTIFNDIFWIASIFDFAFCLHHFLDSRQGGFRSCERHENV